MVFPALALSPDPSPLLGDPLGLDAHTDCGCGVPGRRIAMEPPRALTSCTHSQPSVSESSPLYHGLLHEDPKAGAIPKYLCHCACNWDVQCAQQQASMKRVAYPLRACPIEVMLASGNFRVQRLEHFLYLEHWGSVIRILCHAGQCKNCIVEWARVWERGRSDLCCGALLLAVCCCIRHEQLPHDDLHPRLPCLTTQTQQEPLRGCWPTISDLRKLSMRLCRGGCDNSQLLISTSYGSGDDDDMICNCKNRTPKAKVSVAAVRADEELVSSGAL
jgi:hypothetical protein